MKIAVPGRICLFGEHSDWAGGYRRINANLNRGYTIISGTNHSICADVEPHPTKLIIKSSFANGKSASIELPMTGEALLEEAESGGVFSYAAGVAYQVLTHYRVSGLVIDNYKTDLPIKKGLSSSAAFCVLVARAFNRIYNLKMTIRGEMEFAYMGEITTPSRCGRMDQGCAYGTRPVMMVFDGERIDVAELSVKQDLHFLIVDLGAGKDTLEILKKLNRCYPFADDEIQKGVQEYLSNISAAITLQARDALEAGDAARLGALMTKAQAEFDRYMIPACPSQLTAPVLHKVLNYEPLKPYVFGGKGVGSQGDGSAQFVARGAEAREKAMEIITRDLGMSCLKLTLHAGNRLRKAVIPAAGFGTRMFPASKAIKKELFPVLDRDGNIKPVIQAIVEEALSADVDHVCILVQKNDIELFEEFFKKLPRIENYNKLSTENKRLCDYLMDLGRRLTFIPQDIQEGFGHAVYCAREWIGDEPFLLLLGDHLYASHTELSCAQQVLGVYRKTGQSAVGLKVTDIGEVHHFGCVGGVWKERDRILSITEFKEKPSPEYARENLQIEGMERDKFLSVFGIYVLAPKIFDYLEENIKHNNRENGEFQLTSCLERLRQEEGFAGCVVDGKRFDIGLPQSYRQTMIDYPLA
ncbi:MAG: GHMP kinase [Acidobacteria bacterium]|nr:GHMP kinase [Acidobacteriota bacterium]